jgi:ribosomal protein L16 Arg81 hydroxylase
MTVTSYPLLTAMMSPCSAEEFLSAHFPRRAFVAHGPPERLPALFRDPALASARELGSRYTKGRLRFTHGDSKRMLQMADSDAASLLDMGLTVQFVDIANVLPEAAAFLAALRAELGVHEGALNLSAFAAPPGAGLAVHFDTCELISVQLVGTKHFHYAPVNEIHAPSGRQYAPDAIPPDDLYPQACRGFPDPSTSSFESATLAPGSVLFLPRGMWHYTEAGGDSLSISISVDPTIALNCLLDQLRLVLLQDERWRQPLFGGFGDEPRDVRVREDTAQLLATLPATVARLTAYDLLQAPASLAWRLQHVSAHTRFQRTPHTYLEVGEAGSNGLRPLRFMMGHTQSLARRLGDGQASDSAVALLRWIEARVDGPFRVSAAMEAFPDLPLPTLRQVLELCVQRQFLALLWFPEAVPA